MFLYCGGVRQVRKPGIVPPKEIEGIGDEAYWAGGHIGGALYVLKRDLFLRISVGGLDKEEVKIDKSKKLAENALRRL